MGSKIADLTPLASHLASSDWPEAMTGERQPRGLQARLLDLGEG